jgi:hypothetical protein
MISFSLKKRFVGFRRIGEISLYCSEYIDFHDSITQPAVKSNTAGREARMPNPRAGLTGSNRCPAAASPIPIPTPALA